ncbi:MAG: hypothetical protein CM15mP83_8340 [Flavobacteriaceae bacterium]|nr:MAG: hypothetical protein CM15mP83_8340 [Flavobacteriaceae bacterium]
MTSINGTSNESANDFAKEFPTNSEPISPGPKVYATAFTSFIDICCTKCLVDYWNDILQVGTSSQLGTTPRIVCELFDWNYIR